jgi:hypothetical protein
MAGPKRYYASIRYLFACLRAYVFECIIALSKGDSKMRDEVRHRKKRKLNPMSTSRSRLI